MNIFGIDFSQQSTALFRQSQPARADAASPDAVSNGAASPEAAPGAPETRPTPARKVNLLAGNFVRSGERTDSRYISGVKAKLHDQANFLTQMQSVVAGARNVLGLMSELAARNGEEVPYAEMVLIGQKAADDIKTVIDDEVSDTQAEKLEEMRDEIEEQADEAVAPESEKVLEDDVSAQEALEESLEDVDPTAPEQAAAAAAPAAAPAAQSETPAAQSADAAQEPTPEAVSEPDPQAPAQPSIDLMV
ncbi:hypothetical protein [Pseudodesulfovibrio indicus]|uniref:Uncharacterized protein n=1 Tax=Pseudodesulfovibrio indicus TaxID=1716143 RepID=A0A126QRM6_9BACT|nr:hypothetical protein [Pseudodesulfovibrio indicus]AMK12418.1 hypothetical protein AWY79_15570 [Pseudodesulfovibrio indicus]TDT90717.1 hypothetical protein EDC59_102147 [Pseudodesulfovibrio indicus]